MQAAVKTNPEMQDKVKACFDEVNQQINGLIKAHAAILEAEAQAPKAKEPEETDEEPAQPVEKPEEQPAPEPSAMQSMKTQLADALFKKCLPHLESDVCNARSKTFENFWEDAMARGRESFDKEFPERVVKRQVEVKKAFCAKAAAEGKVGRYWKELEQLKSEKAALQKKSDKLEEGRMVDGPIGVKQAEA